MKAILIGLISILSIQVKANEFKSLLSSSSIQPQKYLVVQKAVPQIAHPASMRARISKKTFVQDSNAAYHWDEKTVCQVQAVLNVTDSRIVPESSNPTSLSCESILDNKPIQVFIGGLMAIENYELFDNEPKAAIKFAGAFMSYSPDAARPNLVNPFDVSGTRDISLKSLVFSLQPPTMCSTVTNGPTKCNVNEFFSAVVEFTDLAPQL